MCRRVYVSFSAFACSRVCHIVKQREKAPGRASRKLSRWYPKNELRPGFPFPVWLEFHRHASNTHHTSNTHHKAATPKPTYRIPSPPRSPTVRKIHRFPHTCAPINTALIQHRPLFGVCRGHVCASPSVFQTRRVNICVVRADGGWRPCKQRRLPDVILPLSGGRPGQLPPWTTHGRPPERTT